MARMSHKKIAEGASPASGSLDGSIRDNKGV